MDITGEFWSRFDTWAGPPFGVFLLLIGVFLMIRGAKRIKILSFLTGCALGQLFSAFLYDNLSEYVTYSEGDFTIMVTIISGVLLFLAIGLMSLAVTAYISLHVMLWIISMLEANGFDVGTELVGGILVGVSFLINRYLRKNLFLFGSAALGSLITIYGFLVLNGEIPSEISIMNPSTQLIGLALFVNSLMIQRKILKSEEIDTEEKELSKAIEERKAIENDSLGSRRYFEPDILTQAVIEERSYKHTNAYNLNLNKK